MSKAEKRRIILMKMSFSIRAALFFIAIMIIFAVAGICWCIFGESDIIKILAASQVCVYIYVPICVNYLIGTKERSKIYYLIPRTENEIKQFILYEARLKITVSVFGGGCYLLIMMLLRPEYLVIHVVIFLISNVTYSFVMGCQGLEDYYRKDKKKKKFKNWYLSLSIILTLGIAVGTYITIIEAVASKAGAWFILMGGIWSIGGILYYLWCLYVFQHCEIQYENIRWDDKRLTYGIKQYLI